jgi:Holliday junction resolvase RusA-like endonuclease
MNLPPPPAPAANDIHQSSPTRRSPPKLGIFPHSLSVPGPINDSFQISSIEEITVNKSFDIVLSGCPKAQQHPRIGKSSHSSVVSGKIVTHPVIYNPSQREQRQMQGVFWQAIQPHIEERNQDILFQHPVSIKAVIKFFIPHPNCHFHHGRRSIMNLIDNNKMRSHISKPNLDNMLKFVLDAMEGVIYGNDSHITSITSTKSYDNIGACHGHISIKLTEMPRDSTNDHEVIVIDD